MKYDQTPWLRDIYLYFGTLVSDIAFCAGFTVSMLKTNAIPSFLAQIFTALLSAPGLGHASVKRRTPSRLPTIK